MRLATKYHINNTNLSLRKQFILFSAEDVRILAKLNAWAKRVSQPLAKEFYDHQFTFPESLTFFEAHAREKNMTLTQLRQVLEKAQAGYFCQIFQEAADGGEYGTDYFERRLRVGKLHNVINLPIKWYVGSYTSYQILVRKYLTRTYFFRPRFRSKAEQAIFKVFNYDIQAVTDAFFYDYLETVGLDLATVKIKSTEHDLSEYYADFKTTMRATLTETTKSANHLLIAARQLASIADQAGLATSQIASTMQNVAYGTEQQTSSVTKASNIVGSVSQAIDSVAKGAQEQTKAVLKSAEIANKIATAIHQVVTNAQTGAKGATEAAQLARDGAETVEETIEKMNTIKTRVGLSTQKVQEMGQRSAQIGAIVETIDDIASQTNLLALNAAIEAARAGEHGKGFAVVADEVRKLAEKSAEATKEIADLIKGIQETVSEAVVAMEEGASEVESGASRANDAGRALADILKAVEAVNEQVKDISAAAQQMAASSNELDSAMEAVSTVVKENTSSTKEMATSSSEVSQAIDNIAGVSRSNSAAVEEVSAATEEMSAQVEEVSASAQTLSNMAQALQQLVAQFNLDEDETTPQTRSNGTNSNSVTVSEKRNGYNSYQDIPAPVSNGWH
ncbi:MAG: globin-coupled sensor protein [Anaerolineae bacterium]|nr:globin-coupled sensor protein [Anaerolineae bacterium]